MADKQQTAPLADLAGQRVLVTGASSGIGAAIAVGFGRFGAHVVLHHRSSGRVGEVAEQVRAAGAASTQLVRGDFDEDGAPEAVVARAIQQVGDLDVLVNNVGDIVERRPLDRIDLSYLHAVCNLNLFTSVLASKAAMPSLLRRKGAVINVSSVAAQLGGGGGSGVYAAAKAAVEGFTRALAKDYASEGVRVNAIAPGVVDTPFHDRHGAGAPALPARAAEIPMGRVGEPADCVGAALYFASPAASGWTTGQTLHVNGGRFMT